MHRLWQPQALPPPLQRAQPTAAAFAGEPAADAAAAAPAVLAAAAAAWQQQTPASVCRSGSARHLLCRQSPSDGMMHALCSIAHCPRSCCCPPCFLQVLANVRSCRSHLAYLPCLACQGPCFCASELLSAVLPGFLSWAVLPTLLTCAGAAAALPGCRYTNLTLKPEGYFPCLNNSS